MIRVALIEDEMVTLKGMTNFLNKMENVDLVGSADNGIDGLQLILKEQPEVVFTDIRMPGLTGLEVIEQVQRQNPEIIFIIFSGFDEFKYVQQAMHLGVLEYLDKPVTVGKLKDALSRAEAAVEYKRNYSKLKKQNAQVEKVMVEKMLGNLFNQPAEMEEKNIDAIINSAEELALSTEIVVLCIDRITSGKGDATQESYQRVLNAYGKDLVQERQVEIYTLSINEKLYCIYFNQECELFPFYAEFEKQKRRLADHDEIEFYAGMSTAGQNIRGLRQLLMEATNAYQYALYLEKEEIVTIDSVEYDTNVHGDPGTEQVPFLMNFRLKDFSSCREQITAYLDSMRNTEIMPVIMKHECLNIVNTLLRTSSEMGVEVELRDELLQNYEKTGSAREIINQTLQMVDSILEKMEAQAGEEQKPVDIIKAYLQSHYSEQISLDVLADLVRMNPTYLSMVFKKEAGISYSSYLTGIRMEKAGELLLSGEKAKDVCEKVGYFDYRYFSRQFKKAKGVSPDVYRQLYHR